MALYATICVYQEDKKMPRQILILTLACILITAQPAFAYIDPGVGSMLFSVVLCAVGALYFLLNSLILKFKTKIFAKKSLAKNNHKFVVYSEGKQYYSVFKPILDEFEKRNIEVMYYTSARDDEIFNENHSYIKKEYIGKGNSAYFKLAFLRADVCLMTTPQLDVLQLKRSPNVKHYSHIMHSIAFAMLYRLFSLDYYDSVLCDADYQIPMIRELEKKRGLPAKELLVVGSTYMDFNSQRLPQKKYSEHLEILIAPTWGQSGLLAKFGEKILDELINNTNYKITVRPHPQSVKVEKGLIAQLQRKFRNPERLKWDFSADNLQAMANADVLISDFSGIMFDYAFLFKKPFLYVDTDINYEIYDFSDLDEKITYKHKVASLIGRKLNIENGDVKNIQEIIEEINQNPDIEKNIELACNNSWQYRGNAAKNVVDFLIAKQAEVIKEC